MSYQPPNQGGYYQQPPYGAPPPQGYPPAGQYPHPGYPPQQAHHQQPYGYPPQQPPPPQNPYGGHSPYPPNQGGYAAPPPPHQHAAAPYGQPPHGHPPHGYPQHGQPAPGQPPYGQPAYGQAPYGAPPLQQQQLGYGHGQAPPPHQGYGATSTPMSGPAPIYGAPSLYVLQPANIDMSGPADQLRRAMKGFGTDEKVLIQVLAKMPAAQVPTLKDTYKTRHRRSLAEDVEKEVSGKFETCLLSILRGPLANDVHALHYALKGAGTNEDMLNDILIGKTNAEIECLKRGYRSTYHTDLVRAVKDDLSMKTETLFQMILSARKADETSPVIPQAIDADVLELHRHTAGRGGVSAEQVPVCSILTGRSNAQIRAIANVYEQKYHTSLERVIIQHFSGHMESALVQCVRVAADKAMCDAIRLEDAMKGAGTQDNLLIERVVGIHWDQQHVQQVRGAYKHRYGQDLLHRIRGETSGDYERCLLAMLE